MSKRICGVVAVLLWALLPTKAVLAAVEAVDGWTRETPPGTAVAVGYLTLKNTSTGRRELLKITSPIATQISLHQSSIDANGVARMWPVGKLELAPGETLTFGPAGKHLMIEGLSTPLRAGMHIPVTMVFGGEPPVTVQLDVRSLVEAPAVENPHAGHDMHAGHDGAGVQSHH